MPGWGACKGAGDREEVPAAQPPWTSAVSRSEAYERGWEDGRAALLREAGEPSGADVVVEEPIRANPPGTPIEAPEAFLEPYPGLRIVSWEGMAPDTVGWFRLPSEGDTITVYRPDGPPGRYVVEKSSTEGEGEPILQTLRLRLAPSE